MFSALRHRNYRLWVMGQLVSLLGTWMQITAQGYLVFELTKSPAYLGLVGFSSGIPAWIFMLYGGVVADRVARRPLLVVTQASMMVCALVLAGLTFAGWVQGWHIVVLAFCIGTANAFDAPARQAFVVEMVGRDDLANAIALNSGIFNTASALGPAVAGIVYSLAGPQWCFTINGLSFLGVIVALLLMHVDGSAVRARPGSALDDIKEGFRYVVDHRAIRSLMLLVTMMSLFGLSFITLLPAWTVKVLGGDARTFGFLQSARGVGALLGALMLASLARRRGNGRMLSRGSLLFPVLVLLLSGLHSVPSNLVLLLVIGWAFMIFFNTANVLLQSHTPDALRGRVMSIYTLSFFGFMPIGALLAGAVAERLGEPLTVALGASVALLTALTVRLRVPALHDLD